MKIICSDHQGIVEVTGIPYMNVKNVLIEDLVINCPICEDEVIINGRFDYDENGNPQINKE